MDRHLISYYLGIVLVFLTHIVMLSTELPKDAKAVKQMLVAHSIINIIAALCIAYYFMHKEKHITW